MGIAAKAWDTGHPAFAFLTAIFIFSHPFLKSGFNNKHINKKITKYIII